MSGISLPIIDNLEHPPVGALFRTAVPGNPFAGPFVALAPASASLFKVYGVCLRVHSVGVFHARDTSFPVEYDPPLGKMAVLYHDASGVGVVQQLELWTFDDQWYVWREPLPSIWSIYLQPDVTADLFWLGTPL